MGPCQWVILVLKDLFCLKKGKLGGENDVFRVRFGRNLEKYLEFLVEAKTSESFFMFCLPYEGPTETW